MLNDFLTLLGSWQVDDFLKGSNIFYILFWFLSYTFLVIYTSVIFCYIFKALCQKS